MSTMKFLSLIGSIFLLGCGYDRFSEYDIPRQSIPIANMTIEDFNHLYVNKPVVVNSDYIIEGYVTSSDRGSNFFKSFIIQDKTGAIEIMAGLYNLSNIYPINQKVVVLTRGLTLSISNSVRQLGVAKQPGMAGDLDYFGYRSELDRYVLRTDNRSSVEPTTTDIPSLNLKMCGKLIKIDRLQSVDQYPTTWGDVLMGEPTVAYRRLVDQTGKSIYLVISPFANFANGVIPSGILSVEGILQYGKAGFVKDAYILKIIDIQDVVVQ